MDQNCKLQHLQFQYLDIKKITKGQFTEGKMTDILLQENKVRKLTNFITVAHDNAAQNYDSVFVLFCAPVHVSVRVLVLSHLMSYILWDTFTLMSSCKP